MPFTCLLHEEVSSSSRGMSGTASCPLHVLLYLIVSVGVCLNFSLLADLCIFPSFPSIASDESLANILHMVLLLGLLPVPRKRAPSLLMVFSYSALLFVGAFRLAATFGTLDIKLNESPGMICYSSWRGMKRGRRRRSK